MLPKKNKLNLGQLSNQQIFKTGKKVGSVSLAVFFLLGGSEFRASVIVSKKRVKSAVKRNQIKRCLYQVLAERKDNIKRAKLVIMVNKVSSVINLKKELISLLDKWLIES